MLVQNNDFVGAMSYSGNRRPIEREQRAQIEDFEFNTLFCQLFRSLKGNVHHGGVGDYADGLLPLSLTGQASLAEGDRVVIGGNIFFNAAVEVLVLEEDAG